MLDWILNICSDIKNVKNNLNVIFIYTNSCYVILCVGDNFLMVCSIWNWHFQFQGFALIKTVLFFLKNLTTFWATMYFFPSEILKCIQSLFGIVNKVEKYVKLGWGCQIPVTLNIVYKWCLYDYVVCYFNGKKTCILCF